MPEENNKINIEHIINSCNRSLDESINIIYDNNMKTAKRVLNMTNDQAGYIELIDQLNQWKHELLGDNQ